MAHLPTRLEEAPSERRVAVALPVGAIFLLGDRRLGGLVSIGSFPHEGSAIVALIRRALAAAAVDA